MNLFGTVLTYTAPSANYRGESAENRSVIQKLTLGRFEYAIISPEAMRNAIRETLGILELPCNRRRIHDQDQLAVAFEDYPDPDKFADDFFMGWLIAANKTDRDKILKEIESKGRGRDAFSFKRDSVLRMNLALALEPYRHNSIFTQSPLDATSNAVKAHKNADSSQLLHRETVWSAFQYPFALNLNDCKPKPAWTKTLLKAIGQLNNVAGNHARSYFEMSPASIVLRLTSQLVAGYDNYGFSIAENGSHTFLELTQGIKRGDYPGAEFYFGGKIVKDMDAETLKEMKSKGVTCDRNPQQLLKTIGTTVFPD